LKVKLRLRFQKFSFLFVNINDFAGFIKSRKEECSILSVAKTNGSFTLVKFGAIMPMIWPGISCFPYLPWPPCVARQKIEMILSLSSVAVTGIIAYKYRQCKWALIHTWSKERHYSRYRYREMRATESVEIPMRLNMRPLVKNLL